MKRVLLTTVIAVSGIAGLLAFRATEQGSIKGSVEPADAVTSVKAINGVDTTTASIIDGAFSFVLNAGTYNVIIDAKDPYKDVSFENVEVKDDGAIDLGVIKLEE